MYDQALKYYNKSYACLQELSKAVYKIHNSTGIVYDDKRMNAKAIQFYGKAIAANKKYHSAYYNTGIVYKREKNQEKAIEWYKKAIDINPRYSYAYNNLANIYKTRNKY